MKTCSKCKIEKPFEAFYKNKSDKDGHRSQCKECVKLRMLELKKNPLLQLEKQIRSSVILENKLLKRENKKLCTGCKEVFLIEDLVSGVFCKECNIIYQKEYQKEYREKNKDKILEYSRENYEKNKNKILKHTRRYRQKNKKIIKERNKQYYLKKKLEKLQNNDTQT